MLVAEDRADHIDLNFGCPVPKVTRKGGGAALPVEARPVPRHRRGRREGRRRHPADRQDAQGHRRRPPHLPRGRPRRRGRGRRGDRPARAHRGRVLLRHGRLVGDREAQGDRHERPGARQRRHLVAPTTRCAWSPRPAATASSSVAAASAARGCSATSPRRSGASRPRAQPVPRRGRRTTFRRHAELLVEFFDERGARLPRHPQARRLVLQGLPGRRRAAGGARDASSRSRSSTTCSARSTGRSRTRARTPRVSAAARAPRRTRPCPRAGSTRRELAGHDRTELVDAELDTSGG